MASLFDLTRCAHSISTADPPAKRFSASGIHFSRKEHRSCPSAPSGSPTSLRLFNRDLVSKSKSLSSIILLLDSSALTLAYKIATSSSVCDTHNTTCDTRSVNSFISFFYISCCHSYSIKSRCELIFHSTDGSQDIICLGALQLQLLDHH